MEQHALVQLAEELIARERELLHGVALGEIPVEVLQQWEQSHGGKLLDVLRKMSEATVKALEEMERLGLYDITA